MAPSDCTPLPRAALGAGRGAGAAPGPAVHQVINYAGFDRGGAERLACQLHLDLRAAGLDARLIALEAGGAAGVEGAHSLGLASPYDPRALLRLAARLRATLRPGDVLHAHLFPTSALVAALRRLGVVRVPCIFTEHSTSNRRRGRAWGSALDRAVYGRFDRVVAISRGVEAALLEACPALAGRTAVVPNGCALPFAAPPIRTRQETPTLLSIGRLVPQKNYCGALAALGRLGNRRFRYVVVGDGPEREALTRRAAALGLADRVSFVGQQREVAPFLRAADVFLIPSAWEGFGLAAVEAMNAGLPVVAADVPGLGEVVGADGDCALLVDPARPETIAAALARLLDDAGLCAALGARGHARSRRFDKERMNAAYRGIYRQIAEAHAHAA